uniref:J domain-containing protein n=1 Tax=Ananas comosus var. bracteatus TaxID=296719 RepID=A0A6V7NF92_ANACO|nr:unnamed protein product [Ananas comosus var. bracteatus]
MECNKEEAIRAKDLAEKKMQERDFIGAKKVVLKAQRLYPELENLSQMLTVCEVHCSAVIRHNGEIDWYGILQVEATADDSSIKKQYRKLALLLHPDKNKFAGAEAAFKLIGEAHMTLSDKGKRSLYDMKRGITIRTAPPWQSSQHAKRATSVRNNANNMNFNGLNQQQQQQQQNSAFAAAQTFWTICPLCGMRYQYYRSILNKALRCQNCMKPFIAYDLNAQAVPSQNSSGVSRQHFSGQQINNVKNQQGQFGNSTSSRGFQGNMSDGSKNRGGDRKGDAEGVTGDEVKFEKVNLTKTNKRGRETKPSTVSSSRASTMNMNQRRGRKIDVESSDSDSSSDSVDSIIDLDSPSVQNASQFPRRSTRQKQNVTYKENISDDDDDDNEDDEGNDDDDVFMNPPGNKKLKKNSDTNGFDVGIRGTNPTNGKVGEKQKETIPEKSSNGVGEVNEDTSAESKSGETTDPNSLSYPDPEFFDFDKYRDRSLFEVDQIWALYDDLDGMPRFYARIRHIYENQDFKLRFTWLEHDPLNAAEMAWSRGLLPVACGNFRLGKTEVSQDPLMFSHIIYWEKGKKRNTYDIYPKKGEVWAVYKGWEIEWSSVPDNHRTYEYEIVEVLSDFMVGSGINVIPLVKVKGFVSLFMQAKDKAPYYILSSEILRFSHRVPSHRMSGAERDGVPQGSFELDPASLPINMENVFPSVPLECGMRKTGKVDGELNGISPEGSTDDARVGSAAANETERVSKKECDNSQSASTSHYPDGYRMPEFCNFDEGKLISSFQPGQIWALYSEIDKFPKYFGCIHKVNSQDCLVELKWLEICPQREEEKRWSREGLPIGCGTFKVTNECQTFVSTDAFSHLVNARLHGRKNQYEIFPSVGEIWALYKNWRPSWTLFDFENCEFDVVEICERTGAGTKVSLLTRVDGYRTVFMPDKKSRVVEVPEDEYLRFSHRIRAFQLMDQRGGMLRGYWELDPASLPEAMFKNPR